ncbi:hypothetical protein [Jannaschia seohaensis]|uniref:TFIIB zinc-binding n=1 Tax=Jannaschia seohaensis TaxID=475081 RepID=A0A2Y9B241_9RHOB|nr:hypothetical protein [Jannaschia seohaensis]PWJ13258.1 hypothetical protein BCF38_11420 [Jannaschia seohaensis]SSA50584.1 hypothetical protein SAMN05421539_11420 [Jannaschia seohaensis]
MPDLKVATCCYCGARTTLRPTAQDGHGLACGSCGAPLTRMKALRPEQAQAAARHPTAPHPMPMKPPKKKRKKKKSLFHKLAKEVWDEIEEIFD